MAEAKANGSGKKNGNGRRAAIQAAAAVLAHLVQDERHADHFRISIAVDYPDIRLEVGDLSLRLADLWIRPPNRSRPAAAATLGYSRAA